MFEGVFQLIRHVKLLTEAVVIVGIGLLIFYWSVTISFFPPALSLGDIAKLLVIAVVGAFTFSLLTIYTICFGAVLFVLFLHAVRFLKLSFGTRRKFLRALKVIEISDLKLMALFGSFFLPFYFVSNIFNLSVQSVLGVLIAAISFSFLVTSQMLYTPRPGVRHDEDEELEQKIYAKRSLVVGLFLGVLSALVTWGGPNAFLYATMKQAGVLSLNQSVFLERKFCPMLGNAFDLEFVEGYCYFEGADILFQGMGDRLLLANLRKDFRLSVPENAVLTVSGFNGVDTSWTLETTKPARGGLSH